MNGTQGAQAADSDKVSAVKDLVQQTADSRQQTAVQRDGKKVLAKYIVNSTFKTLPEEERKEVEG